MDSNGTVSGFFETKVERRVCQIQNVVENFSRIPQTLIEVYAKNSTLWDEFVDEVNTVLQKVEPNEFKIAL